MTEISVLDLQNLRHLIGGFETTHCKMPGYPCETLSAKSSQYPPLWFSEPQYTPPQAQKANLKE